MKIKKEVFMQLKDVYSCNNAPGNRYLKMYMEGKSLTLKQASLAKCAECMNGFIDGKNDCEMNGICPLYPFMPYRKEPAEYKKRKVSVEHIKKMTEGKRIKSK